MSRAPPPADAEILDGRRRRGQDNRARIVAAMLAMVREGDFAPSAEHVAARADVGLRTVFRHFQDMDSLYGEMSSVVERELAGMVLQPFQAQTWQGRIVEMVARRSVGFEKVLPFHQAGVSTRHRSRVLAASHKRMVKVSRDIVVLQLPAEVAADRPLVEILDLLLSVETWARLRVQQGLSPKAAREALEAAVRRLVG